MRLCCHPVAWEAHLGYSFDSTRRFFLFAISALPEQIDAIEDACRQIWGEIELDVTDGSDALEDASPGDGNDNSWNE